LKDSVWWIAGGLFDGTQGGGWRRREWFGEEGKAAFVVTVIVALYNAQFAMQMYALVLVATANSRLLPTDGASYESAHKWEQYW